MLLRNPSLLRGNSDTNYINHAQIRYMWEIKHSALRYYALRSRALISHTYLLGMIGASLSEHLLVASTAVLSLNMVVHT